MNYGYIYKTTNLINNKTYIGQHKGNVFDKRYKGSGKILKQALIKNGRKNFKTEILEWCKTKEELDVKEIEYIAFYRSKGKAEYNITDGGNGSRGLFGEKNPFYGKTHSEKTRKIISERRKLIKGKDHPSYGIRMTPEHIAKTRRTGSTQSKETRKKISNSLKKERKCKYCNISIKGFDELNQHIKENHKDLITENLISRNKEIFKCPYCNQEIRSRGNLTQHIRAKHNANYKK